MRHVNLKMSPQRVDEIYQSMHSDINSTVAFFRMLFFRSTLLIRTLTTKSQSGRASEPLFPERRHRALITSVKPSAPQRYLGDLNGCSYFGR